MAKNQTLLSLGLLASALFSCCGQSVGYQGPLPSSQARQSLSQLWGKTLPAGSVAFTAKEVTLVSFLVGPNAPTVIAEEPGEHAQPRDGRHRIPVFTDGDIADLFQRATGEAVVPVPTGQAKDEPVVWALSEGYRRKMTGK